MTSLKGLRCLVLGGGGFIGTNLCRALVTGGAKVSGFGRRAHYPAALEGVAWTTGDVGDQTDFTKIVKGQDVLFHLIGDLNVGSEDTAESIITSTKNTLNLLDACRTADVRRIVFVSSGGAVYGVPASTPISETAATNPISAYGVSKLAIEKILHLYHHLHGIDYSALRVANPYGRFQSGTRGQGVVAALLDKAISGQPLEVWGTGKIVRDYIYIDDVVDALIAVLDYHGSHRVFNVGTGIGRSVLEIIEDIRHTVSRDELEIDLKPGRPTDVPVNVLDIGLIRDELGWAPKMSWSDGLSATASWLRATATTSAAENLNCTSKHG